MLARREMSEVQVRRRLTLLGHDGTSIDAAVERLTAERSLDDVRMAGALARTELRLRPRGRRRITERLEAAGIAADLAEQAVEDAFHDVDIDALLAAALAKRHRGGPLAERDLPRLYRALTAQGFEPDRVMALLRRHTATPHTE